VKTTARNVFLEVKPFQHIILSIWYMQPPVLSNFYIRRLRWMLPEQFKYINQSIKQLSFYKLRSHKPLTADTIVLRIYQTIILMQLFNKPRDTHLSLLHSYGWKNRLSHRLSIALYLLTVCIARVCLPSLIQSFIEKEIGW